MSKAILSATLTLAAGTLFLASCATKNYVKQQIQPIDQKVDQVDKSSQSSDASQVSDINKTNQTVGEDEKQLSATTEIAHTADTESKGAMAKSNQNTKDLNDLRNVVANIDDYKPAGQTVVHFAVNKDTLTKVLTYHVVPGRMTAVTLMKAVKDGEGEAKLKTVASEEIIVKQAGPGKLTVTDSKGDVAMVTIADVLQSNGVIHVIDTVLLP